MTDDSYDRIATSFHRRIDNIASAVDTMAPGLGAAASLLTQAVLEDRKILVCGCGEDATLAAHIAAVFRTPIDSGPTLPALAFYADHPLSEDASLWRDMRTISRDGDVLMCVDSLKDAPMARQCISFAAKRNLVAIALSENPGVDGAICLDMRVADRNLRSELLLMATHCLQEQIKQFLLGE